ncbi:Sodium/hydrogen exchanger family protein [compost metagenome]
MLVGVVLTWVIGQINRLLVHYSGEDPAIAIIVSMLIPFAAFLAGEHLHVSGILAAAAAGVCTMWSCPARRRG